MKRRTACRAAPALVLGLVALACGAERDPGSGAGRAAAPDRGGAVPAAATTAPPRHLVLVTVDTLRADRVGAWGDALARTPHLDRLARDGVRFAHAIAPVPLTLPTHAVMLTGRRPPEIGVRVNGFDHLGPEHRTLAEILSEEGFETAAMVASYVLTRKFGLDQGFGVYDDRLGTGGLASGFASEIPADRVVDKVDAWLGERRPPHRRTFLWVHFYDPHLPYEPPAGFADGLDPYRGEIAFADEQLGRLLGLLDRAGILDEALVAVTSDHGEAFSEHGEEGHGLLTYQETLAVPLVVHHPPTLPPAVVEERVGLVDLAPTLLAALGIEAGAGMSGRSRLPGRDEGGPVPSSAPIYFESLAGQVLEGWAPIHGVVDGDHKLIAYLEDPELYDLAADPGEERDLSAREPALAARLRGRLRSLLDATAVVPDPGAGGRGLDAEDRRHLQALGYLGTAGVGRGGEGLDPRQGMAIELELRRVRTLVEAGQLGEARSRLDALEGSAPDVRTPDHFELAAAVASSDADALERLAEGVARFPSYFPLRFTRASRLLAAGLLEEAETEARRLAEDPHRSEAWNLLGEIAERRGDLGSAVASYRRALGIEGGSVQFRLRLADALVRSGEPTEALEHYEAALADGFVDDPEVFQRAALVAAHLGDPGRAERFFRGGLDHGPGPLYRLAWGLFLAEQGRADEARAELRAVLHAERAPERARGLARAMLDRLGPGS